MKGRKQKIISVESDEEKMGFLLFEVVAVIVISWNSKALEAICMISVIAISSRQLPFDWAFPQAEETMNIL